MNQLDVIKDMWVMISSDIDNLIDYMPMFVASNEEDKKLLMVTWDMLKTFRKEITNATSISELNEILDVDRLCEDWARVKESIYNYTDREIYAEKERILKEFDIEI